MSISKTHAASLAVSYHAFMTAVNAGDSNGIVIWGRDLLRDQNDTNVFIIPPNLISENIANHEERRRFEVSASWMKACGKGDQPKTFEVIKTWSSAGLNFAELNDGGRHWTIITDWLDRGQFVA